MIGTVPFVDTAASRTGARGVARVYRDHWHARQRCLVLDKRTELGKRPAMQGGASGLSSRYPLADVRQILQRNPASCAFGLFHDAFADAVVGVRGETLFSTRQLLQVTAGAIRLCCLQSLAQAAMTVAHPLYALALMHFAVTVGGDVRNTEINAKPAFRVNWRFVGNVAGRVQVELALAMHQVAFAALVLKQRQLMRAGHERDGLPTAKQPDRHGAVGKAEVQDATVIRYSAKFAKLPLRLFVQLVGVNDFANTADDQLRRQVKIGPYHAVRQAMHRHAAKALFGPCSLADVVAGGIGAFQRGIQQVALFFGGLKLNRRGQFHALSIAQNFYTVNMLKRKECPASSPR